MKFKAKRYTAALCRCCGKVLVSLSRHDYKTCGCPNETMVDGGADYARYGGMDLNKVAYGVFIFNDELEKEREEA